MIKKTAFLLLAALFPACCLFAQSPVSADPLTGAANVTIPIYTLSSGQVSVPVYLQYSGSGVKPKDVEGNAGMGWQIPLAQVSRVVRGLPDDATKDDSGNTRLGWMSTSNTSASAIAGFTIQNDGSTCSKETSDINYINYYFSSTSDTEPDLFYVSAPGLSCQLVFNRDSAKFKPVNYQDLLIGYGTDATTHLITSFTITNNKGITYTFGNNNDLAPAHEYVTEKTFDGSSAAYFKNKYLRYQYGIDYYDSWGLLSITDAHGNGVQFNYTAALPQRTGLDSVSLYIGGVAGASLQYYDATTSSQFQLQGIQTFNTNGAPANSLNFTWTTFSASGQTGQSAIAAISGMGRNFVFVYSPVSYTGGYTRNFLRSFGETACSSPVSYTFGYAGETNTGGNNYITALPDSSSNQTDYWDYYSTSPSGSSQIPSVYVNPATPTYQRYLIQASHTVNPGYTYGFSNTSRQVVDSVIADGSLNKITYATGGNTSIVYEPNDYYDVSSGAVSQGGGIRVKQIVDQVVNAATGNNITRNYTYVNSSGVSTGKPVSLPQYAFTIPYSGSATGLSLWQQATALSAHDLSKDDHTIMYASSTMSQTNAGYTVYNYSIPATYWDASAAPSCSGCAIEWYPTINYAARNDCSATYGPVTTNATYLYPFVPNPNYDFERGLPTSVVNFTDAGRKVSETDYTYQRSYTPSSMWAFEYDNNVSGSLTITAYDKYLIYYNTSELTATVTKTVFGSSTGDASQTSTSTYTYGSASHKLVTKIQATNSDGRILTTNINYVKDYAATPDTSQSVTALYHMQLQNINVPVETWQQVTTGGTTTTTSAALSMFRDSTIGTTIHCLPSRQMKWIAPDGNSFTPMHVSGTGSSQTLTWNPGYFITANYDYYDNTGFPLTTDDNNKHIQTTLVNHWANQPIAVFKNAAYSQVAYSDFDGDVANPPYAFTISGTGFTAVGSHAGNAYGLNTSQTVSHTVAKNPLAQNYIFSIWVNAPTGTNTLNIALNGGTAVPYTYTGTGAWQYCEWKLPVSSMPSTFLISFNSAQAISIDDVLFYPDVAEAATATYDPTTYYKLDATNTNGVSAYYTTDQWGRVLYTFDQDRNIVQKNTFMTPASVASMTGSAITYTTFSPVNGQPQSFAISGPDACSAAGISVSWNFGDGTILPGTGLTSPAHTYPNAINVTYTVSATITSPFFGTVTPAPFNITITPASIPTSYTSYTMGHGDISLVQFKQGGAVVLTIDSGHLNTAHVPQGNYTIVVYLSDGQPYNPGTGTGYGNVTLTSAGSCYSSCQNYSITNTYSFSANISACTNLVFTVNQLACSPPGGG